MELGKSQGSQHDKRILVKPESQNRFGVESYFCPHLKMLLASPNKQLLLIRAPVSCRPFLRVVNIKTFAEDPFMRKETDVDGFGDKVRFLDRKGDDFTFHTPHTHRLFQNCSLPPPPLIATSLNGCFVCGRCDERRWDATLDQITIAIQDYIAMH